MHKILDFFVPVNIILTQFACTPFSLAQQHTSACLILVSDCSIRVYQSEFKIYAIFKLITQTWITIIILKK